jgi:hypothetical protein
MLLMLKVGGSNLELLEVDPPLHFTFKLVACTSSAQSLFLRKQHSHASTPLTSTPADQSFSGPISGAARPRKSQICRIGEASSGQPPTGSERGLSA